MDQRNSTFGAETPSSTGVYRWFAEFNRGLSSLQNEFREGCPKSVGVPKTINADIDMILQDRHVIYCEILTTLGSWRMHLLEIPQ